MAALTIPQAARSAIFLYSNGETAAAIPGWFADWVSLGIKIAQGGLTSGHQTILAVSTPSRMLAAAAVALGYSRQRYVLTGEALQVPELSIALQDVVPGMRLWVKTPNRVIVGEYLRGLPERLQLSTLKTGAFQARMIRQIRTLPEGLEVRDGSWESGSDSDRAFIESLLPNADPEAFLSSWDWSLVLVGSPTRIYADLSERISLNAASRPFGAIGTIVRPMEQSGPVGWRSSIMSARADTPVWEKFPAAPQLVILDGAQAISRWLPKCQAPVVVAVLERTEPGAEAAASALMQERSYAEPVNGSEVPWAPPHGCELLAFRRTY